MKRALISVTNKDGVVDFAKGLVELGFEIVSTGGTMKVLQENGVSCIAIDDVTGFPEMLDGRVKTLHPMVHGGLLYRRDLPSHVETIKKHGIHPIDLVCVNLYEFEKALKAGKDLPDMIENIDIGGPSMIRSAAKNFKDVLIVTDPKDYDNVLSVFIHAPHEYCMEQAAKKQSMGSKELERYIQKIDKHRADYHKYYTGLDWTDARNYDLCLDSSKLGFERCVQEIMSYINVRFN